MNEVTIKKANINNISEIINLNRKLFENEYDNYDNTLNIEWPLSKEGKEYFEDSIKNDIVLVAESNNKVIGYLIGNYHERTYNLTNQAELSNMCILEEYRSLGVGSKLFTEFKNICKENNINEIVVIASYKNKKGIDFYKKNGFSEKDITLSQII